MNLKLKTKEYGAVMPQFVWAELDDETKKLALKRPEPIGRSMEEVREAVETIVSDVRENGDAAVAIYTEKYDGVKLDEFKVGAEEFAAAEQMLSDEVKAAVRTAAGNIRKYHEAQKPHTVEVETTKGLKCWREARAIEKVGLYVPAGVAPLPSTMLMLGIPADIAGCGVKVACVPPQKDGTVHPSILYAAQIAGIKDVFKIGGAQAVAAMAYGTNSVPAVDKIFGPGNPYVTQAKMRVAIDADGAAFDAPFGPSEQLHIADKNASPAFVAADLLSQAEHSIDAHVVLITPSEEMLNKVLAEVEKQTLALPRGEEFVRQALAGSAAILVKDIDEAIEISNIYAPEHLVMNVEKPENFASQITNAGSVFMGRWTPESLGDYASGTNHSLPTQGHAARYSGLTVDAFRKTISFQQASPAALQEIGPTVEILAMTEGLEAHAKAVSIRLKELEK